MAGAGYFDFTAGQVLTDTQVETYLMQQSVMVYASASARNTALSGVVAEGMHAYLTDNNQLCYYTGAAWRVISQPETSWTPTFTNLTVGNGTLAGQYSRAGDLVHATFILTHGSTTSVTGVVSVSNLPVTGSTTTDAVGPATYRDASATSSFVGVTIMTAATTLALHGHGFGQVNATNPFTWTTSDVMRCEITYTAA